ncbi:hypothetical protein [Paludibacterium denitrificans]
MLDVLQCFGLDIVFADQFGGFLVDQQLECLGHLQLGGLGFA